MQTENPLLSYTMTRVRSNYFETSVLGTTPPEKHTERIDIVVGSGRRGQTFLFWKDSSLFELPVTYWSAIKCWINSPGYPDDNARFDKPIVPRCLECHGTYFEAMSGTWNSYKKDSLVLGISCETCHGPGKEHIAAAETGSDDLHIVKLRSLSRPRQMDVCALCHAGAGTEIAPALSFKPGKDLSNYLTVSAASPSGGIDVHGNQVEALEASQCWQSSQKLTCTTCHDVHRTRVDPELYSRLCLECHTTPACGAYHKGGAVIGTRCISCHMPLQQSEALVSITQGKDIRPTIRNHRIDVYPSQPTTELRGDQALASGQVTDAITLFGEALETRPDDAMLEFKLAMALDKAKDIPGEKSALEKAIYVNPDMAIARNQLGYLLVQNGDVVAAEEDFRRAVQASPTYTQAWVNLAATLAMQSKIADAQRAVANALKVDPQNADALRLQQDLKEHP
jgi:Flp pilus assembly protein TadD